MHGARGLLFLAFALGLSLFGLSLVGLTHAQQANTTSEELHDQPVASRRRLLVGAADVTDHLDDVATLDEGGVVDDDRFTVPHDGERPRNPNRRRRKRKRLPPPRPPLDDYDDERQRQGGRDRLRDNADEEDNADLELRPSTVHDEPAANAGQQPFDNLPRYRPRPYRTRPDGRPLRRRRKNRRRPQLEMPEGLLGEEQTGDAGFVPRREHFEEEEERGGETVRGRNRDPEDIPLGGLRGEEETTIGDAREEPLPNEEMHSMEEEFPVSGERRPLGEEAILEDDVGEGVSFPGPRATEATTTTKRPRRRRLRPRVKPQKEATTVSPAEEREALKLRDEVERDEEKLEVGDSSAEATPPLTPIKISLSDLLREKNISLADILKDSVEEPEAPKPVPRLQAKSKPTLNRARLTQLSRVTQLLHKPTQRESSTTHETVETTTTKVTTRATTKETPRTEKATETRAYGTRMPMLSMQETEDIDPVKMTDKLVVRATNNSKAAEFLKSRIRLPPTGVYFPSVKLAKGLRAGAAPAAGTDQDAVPSRDSNAIRQPVVATAAPNQSKAAATAAKQDGKEDEPKAPFYVVNPKFKKLPRPIEALPPTETNLIPVPGLDESGLNQQIKKGVVNSNVKVDIQVDTEPTSAETVTEAAKPNSEPMRLNIPIAAETQTERPETTPTYSKSAEDEIVELLMAENGSGRLSRILAARNMTLSDLITHRERGASQQRISDIFLSNLDSNSSSSLEVTSSTLHVSGVPKLEDLFDIDFHVQKDDETSGEDFQDSSKRVPRVLNATRPPSTTISDDGEVVASIETGGRYDDDDEAANVLPGGDESKTTFPFVETEEYDYGEAYGAAGDGKIENAGKVREVRTKVSNVDHEFDGLPTGMRSILLASSAVLGLAIFLFLAIFITCKVRKQKSVNKRYINRSRMVHRDVEKSPNVSPTLITSGYKDMTIERRYYLWNTIRKTLKYK